MFSEKLTMFMNKLSKFIIFFFIFANLGFLIPLKSINAKEETPKITSISPTIVNIGNKLVINGEGFGTDCYSEGPEKCVMVFYIGDFDGDGDEDLDSEQAKYINKSWDTWTDNKIEVTLLYDEIASRRVHRKFSEKIQLYRKELIPERTDGAFNLYHIAGPVLTYDPEMKITEVSPLSGSAGTEVTIIGKGFKDSCTGKGTLECQAGIYFGNGYVNAVADITQLVSWEDTKIVVKVPSDATTGNIRVYRNEILDYGTDHATNQTFDIIGHVFGVNHASGQPSVDSNIVEIKETTRNVVQNNYTALLAEVNALRSQVKEQEAEIKYLKSLTSEVKNISESMKSFMTNFVTYGVDENTKKLGEGERAAVLNSFKEAYKKLPETSTEIEDAIKIANGRFPSVRVESVENEAEKIFEHVYDRAPDTQNASDQNFTMVVSYGLRQKAETRKLETEKKALDIYKGVYKQLPQNTEDWNILQGIAYSGAKK